MVRTWSRAAAKSFGAATARTPALLRSRGSKPEACRESTSTSWARSGRGRISLSRKRSSWASGSG